MNHILNYRRMALGLIFAFSIFEHGVLSAPPPEIVPASLLSCGKSKSPLGSLFNHFKSIFRRHQCPSPCSSKNFLKSLKLPKDKNFQDAYLSMLFFDPYHSLYHNALDTTKELEVPKFYTKNGEKPFLDYKQARDRIFNKKLEKGALPLSLKTILETHKDLLGTSHDEGVTLGRFRNSEVHYTPEDPTLAARISTINPLLHAETGRTDIEFLPFPSGVSQGSDAARKFVEDHLTNVLVQLQKEMRDAGSNVDKLQHAIGRFYRQFMSIHPFEDGNGRVGRLLVERLLAEHNINPPIWSRFGEDVELTEEDFLANFKKSIQNSDSFLEYACDPKASGGRLFNIGPLLGMTVPASLEGFSSWVKGTDHSIPFDGDVSGIGFQSKIKHLLEMYKESFDGSPRERLHISASDSAEAKQKKMVQLLEHLALPLKEDYATYTWQPRGSLDQLPERWDVKRPVPGVNASGEGLYVSDNPYDSSDYAGTDISRPNQLLRVVLKKGLKVLDLRNPQVIAEIESYGLTIEDVYRLNPKVFIRYPARGQVHKRWGILKTTDSSQVDIQDFAATHPSQEELTFLEGKTQNPTALAYFKRLKRDLPPAAEGTPRPPFDEAYYERRVPMMTRAVPAKDARDRETFARSYLMRLSRTTAGTWEVLVRSSDGYRIEKVASEAVALEKALASPQTNLEEVLRLERSHFETFVASTRKRPSHEFAQITPASPEGKKRVFDAIFNRAREDNGALLSSSLVSREAGQSAEFYFHQGDCRELDNLLVLQQELERMPSPLEKRKREIYRIAEEKLEKFFSGELKDRRIKLLDMDTQKNWVVDKKCIGGACEVLGLSFNVEHHGYPLRVRFKFKKNENICLAPH